MSNKRGLNLRQSKFCTYWIQYGNATKAARKAGYSKKTAYSIGNRLLKNVEVLKTIQSRLQRVSSRKVATRQELFQFLTKAVRGQLVEYDTGSGVDGTYKIEKPPDVSDRIHAAVELLKRDDPVEIARGKAQLEKINAEARIKKYQTKQLDSAQNKTINQTTKLLKALENDTKDPDKKD